MSAFLDIALKCAARGWHVHPLKHGDKIPLTKQWTKNASTDESTIRNWWAEWPEGNVGIATGLSRLLVLDADTGLHSMEEFIAWRDRNGIPVTYTVRSGGRPGFRVQMYYHGSTRDGRFSLDGVTGDIRSQGGQVVAAGSIHPSGEKYEVIIDAPLAYAPAIVEEIRTHKAAGEKQVWDGPVHDGEGREAFLVSEAGRMRDKGYSEVAIVAELSEINAARCIPAKPQEDVERIAHSMMRYPPGAQAPEVSIGSKPEEKPVTDWRERYHTFDEMDTAPEPTFIIEGFLQKDVISSIAAPVGQRKTIIAANVVHSSITGAPLFGHFAVKEQPARVLYLCPEMGLYSFAKRIRDLGLMQYVGKTLFCRTMNSEGTLALSDLTPLELTGALVVIDTAVRFVEGDENSSQDMKVFAKDCFRLMKAGAASVLILFHSPKNTKEVSELTLENAMRGSGDLGAFVSSCWATRLQAPDAPWESPSYLKNVKQRDFESDPFEVKSDRLGRLHMLAHPGIGVRLNGKSVGPRGNADGKEEEALRVIRDNAALSHASLSLKLKELGIDRSPSWVGNKRAKVTTTI